MRRAGGSAVSLRIAVAGMCALAALCAPYPAWSDSTATAARAAAAKVNCAKVKCIALTFDDGPGRQAGRLLDTLKKQKAKATFFLEGQYVKARPQFVRRMAKEGHELGNHSYDHPDFTKIDEDAIRAEITDTQEFVHGITGTYPTALRPPFGLVDYRVEGIAAELGLPIVLWNTGSHDWATRSKKAIYNEVLKGARRDSIVLLHDWVTQTVDVMPALLTALKKKGFHIVTVNSLLRGRTLDPGETFPKNARTSTE
jgi:peptidoglycan/xylan/chitin deacetylase (PgdA/CDA1 family)